MNLGILNKVFQNIPSTENSFFKSSLSKTDKIFYPIIGFEGLKEIFQLSLDADRPVHILLVGPPASAKSLFMNCLTKLKRSYYAVGSSSTKSGILRKLSRNDTRLSFVTCLNNLLLQKIEKLASTLRTSRL